MSLGAINPTVLFDTRTSHGNDRKLHTYNWITLILTFNDKIGRSGILELGGL